MSSQKFSPQDYYSLGELLEKLGRDGVAELVSKSRPQRVTQGDMIFFLKTDIDQILGYKLFPEEKNLVLNQVPSNVPTGIPNIPSTGIPPNIPSTGIFAKIVFKQTLLRRYKVGREELVYEDKYLDLSRPVNYGRNEGDLEDQEQFKQCGIISSLHSKLYLDEDNNLLYENFGSNKSKIRGPGEQSYTVLDSGDVGVLIASDILSNLVEPISVSIKLGYQLKPHFIVRITVEKRPG